MENDNFQLSKKVRRIEIKTRRLTDEVLAGSYHSAFKGRGMTFSEVREYGYGDDMRSIDWNVTARFNHPFIKVFEEERDINFKDCDCGGLLRNKARYLPRGLRFSEAIWLQILRRSPNGGNATQARWRPPAWARRWAS